jgi:hypothetical protein
LHVVAQTPPLQAYWSGQSVATEQPQFPLPRQTGPFAEPLQSLFVAQPQLPEMHAWPVSESEQFVQLGPQALGCVSRTHEWLTQHAPVPHCGLDEHVVVQTFALHQAGDVQVPQLSVAPHPSGTPVPQFLPSPGHVCAVHPHMPGVPPPPQVFGAEQETPHEPQLLLSVAVLTQEFVIGQYVVPPGHAGTHFVPSHEALPPLGAAHTAQLAPHALVSLATQEPPQMCIGLVH